MQLQSIPMAREHSVPRGAQLFLQGSPVKSLFLVISGDICLQRHQTDGSFVILQRAASGDVLAEASLYSHYYHCHAIAQQNSRVCALPKASVIALLQKDHNFCRNWIMHLSREVQQARFRSEMLSLKTVAGRLDAWLNWRNEALPPKGDWKSLAGQLSVSPEALYREIARRLKNAT